PGPRSSMPCCCNWTSAGSSIVTSGASMPPSFAPTRPPPGRKKNPDPPPELGGPASAQRPEPEDQALGRSQGGFGTKVHLACDSHGIILAVVLTAGQRHETQGFEEVNRRARRPRQPGRPTWPDREAGDKGYSYTGVRDWLERHHIDPVIPTRKDQ